MCVYLYIYIFSFYSQGLVSFNSNELKKYELYINYIHVTPFTNPKEVVLHAVCQPKLGNPKKWNLSSYMTV